MLADGSILPHLYTTCHISVYFSHIHDCCELKTGGSDDIIGGLKSLKASMRTDAAKKAEQFAWPAVTIVLDQCKLGRQV